MIQLAQAMSSQRRLCFTSNGPLPITRNHLVHVKTNGDHIEVNLVPSEVGPNVASYINADDLIYLGSSSHKDKSYKFTYKDKQDLKDTIKSLAIAWLFKLRNFNFL